jgi:hypothetical protein
MTRWLFSSVLAGALAVLVSGCGGSNSSTSAASTAGASGSTSESGGTIPAALLGTWTTTLKASDLPANPPPELAGAKKWQLQIAETGGVDNGPVLSIVGDLDQLEGPTPQVSGNELKLLHEECAASGTEQFFDNTYSYEIQGDSLRITTVSNQCADHVAETILTSEPWTKKG